jgi:Ethanolamine utilization protein EutJ (predicted chaperonin)
MTRAIGIDLGTTNSVVATISRGKPQVIPTRNDDRDWTPSLVLHERGSFTVGHEVDAIASARASVVAHSVKRLMGRRFHDAEVQRMLSDRRFLFPVVEHPDHAGEIGIDLDGLILTPEEVCAQILRSLRGDAEHTLGEAVGHAVITVPAYFRDPSIVATRQAGRIAGLRVQHVMPEPTAAALAYALGDNDAIEGVRHVLVYDFGGGTFDVSILMSAPGAPLQVLGVDGDNFLGGDDIDFEIARFWDREMRTELGVSVLDGTGASHNGPYPLTAVQWTLRIAARDAKEKLAGSAPSKSITKPALILRDDGTMLSPTWTLSRDVLARFADPKIDKTFEVVERALAAAKLTPADVHDVVVVGGSTKLAGVLERLRSMFPTAEIRNSISPMLVVGVGAAQQTRMLLPWVCSECGRTNDATASQCVGCGADGDRPEHDCAECGAIFSSGDTVCPNPACATRIARPSAPVEVLSHALMLKTVGGEWHTMVARGTPVFPSRKQAAAPSEWRSFAAQRTGQGIELPVGQAADDTAREAMPIAHFRVIDPPPDLVARDAVNVRLVLDGDRAAGAEVEIRGQLYATERVDFADIDESTDVVDEVDGQSGGGRAGWYRLLASGADILPGSSHNPGAQAFVEELREASSELERIAARIETAEKAGDTAEAERLRQEADDHIEENLPIAPTLALAAVLASVTDDLDARRDLQAGIEDVRQAISMRSVDDVKLAFASLNAVMSRVQLPDHDLPGADANLLARYRQ